MLFLQFTEPVSLCIQCCFPAVRCLLPWWPNDQQRETFPFFHVKAEGHEQYSLCLIHRICCATLCVGVSKILFFFPTHIHSSPYAHWPPAAPNAWWDLCTRQIEQMICSDNVPNGFEIWICRKLPTLQIGILSYEVEYNKVLFFVLCLYRLKSGTSVCGTNAVSAWCHPLWAMTLAPAGCV